MRSNNLSAIDDPQVEMALARRPDPEDVHMDIIIRQPNMMAAINLCISASGLEDKEIYLTLGIDAGHWTRIRRGEAHFPVNKMMHLIELCGNKAPVAWLAYQCGDDLVPMRSSLERELEEEKQRRIDAEHQLQTIINYEAAKRQR